MGACNSRPPAWTIHLERPPGIMVVEIIAGQNMPKMDPLSDSDCYVSVRILNDSGLLVMDRSNSTQVRMNDLDPVWHEYASFPIIPEDTDQIEFTVWDQDDMLEHDEIGNVRFSLSELKQYHGEVVFSHLEMKTHLRGRGDAGLKLRLVSMQSSPVPPLPNVTLLKKTLFLIRHGESKWNDAQAKLSVSNMVKQYDHELNNIGIEQAQEFNSRWRKICDVDVEPPSTVEKLPDQDGLVFTYPTCCTDQQRELIGDSDKVVISNEPKTREQLFFEAPMIMVSPLTRAVETSLIALEGHRTISMSGIQLQRNLREAKNVGSFDTVGRFEGDEIKEKVQEELEKQNIGRCIHGVTIDSHDATRCWWTKLSDKERKEDVYNRQSCLWRKLRFGNDHEVLILVGHSHFFRELCKNFLSRNFRKSNAKLAEKLTKLKLDNAACLCIEVEWDCTPACLYDEPAIVDAELMFGSKFAEKSDKN